MENRHGAVVRCVLAACLMLAISCDSIFDFKPPKVWFVTPSAGETVFSPAAIELRVDDEHFKSLDLYVDGNKTNTYQSDSVSDSLVLSDGSHTLRVRAYDKGGNHSDATITVTARVLGLPTLLAPANGSVLSETRPTFSWMYPYAVEEYQIQVDNNSDFASPAVDQSLTDSSHTPTAPLEQGGYYWRVRARVSATRWSNWSDKWSFAIVTQGAPPPTLYLPINGDTTGDATPYFDWSDVGTATKYWLRVDDDVFFLSPEIADSTLTASEYTPTQNLPDGKYYWCVSSQNASGYWGGWSVVWDFTLSQVGVPTLLGPPDSAVLTENRPAFTWSSVSGAAMYWLQVDDDQDFSSPTISDSLAGTTYTPDSALADGKYYWRVRARSEVGVWGGWSGTRSFTVQLPVCDVGCSVIVAPGEIVNPGQVITPACSVCNFGNQSASYQVRMKIGSGYNEVASVSDHGPGTTRYVSFTDWTTGQVGTYTVSCSTELTGDANAANDRARDSVEVKEPVKDVGVIVITAPSVTVNYGTSVTPACSIYNFGTTTESYRVHMKIDTFYNDTVAVLNHTPGTGCCVMFLPWYASQPGTHAVACSTELVADIDSTNDGRSRSTTVTQLWYCATPAAGWSIRYNHATLGFDDRLWVLGGHNSGLWPLGDVWNSADGVTWTADESIEWSGRHGHTAATFAGKMWVLGGTGESGDANDVWCSSDGDSWICVTGSAGWSPRYDHASVVFDNKLWVLGGRHYSMGYYYYYDDVWCSSNGVDWICVNPSAGWPERYDHAAAVFGDKLWVLGGDGSTALLNDVWCSDDGVNWNCVTTSAGWSARSGHTTVVFDNKIWVLGGYDDGSRKNDVWCSSDGDSWTCVTRSAGWSPRYRHASTIFHNGIWVLGGSAGNSDLKNDVWHWP